MPKPHYAQTHSGETEIDFPGRDDSIHYYLTLSWEVEAESLSWGFERIRSTFDDEELLDLRGSEKLGSDSPYLTPRFLVQNYDALIREKLWAAIEDALPPMKPESYYVN